jgi:hypothetical protein
MNDLQRESGLAVQTPPTVIDAKPLSRARNRREPNSLSPKQQFRWGLFGGCIIIFVRLWFFTLHLPPDAGLPAVTFRNFLFCVLWFALPLISGLVARICDPHHPFIAVFEGMSATTLFIGLAKEFPL